MTRALASAIIGITLSFFGGVAMAIEQPEYRVLESDGAFELRESKDMAQFGLAQAANAGIVSGKIGKAVDGFVAMIRDFAQALDTRVPGDLASFVSEVLETSGLDKLDDHSTIDERERVDRH